MRAGTCIHFCGIQHQKCRAGIVLESVRDSSQPGPSRWPCLNLDGKKATTTCGSYAEPTPEQIAEWESLINAALNRQRERAERGECDACGAVIERGEQVGRCVYARPCGHRIGQGDARSVNAFLAKAKAKRSAP